MPMRLVSAYTRSQALEDGVLVDAAEMAKEAGFQFPVALTRAVHDRYVKVPENGLPQSEFGRLWDVLWMLSVAIRTTRCFDRMEYELVVRNPGPTHPNERLDYGDRLVTLKAIVGPGDLGEPVITVLLPGED
jgi:hypothetical protein